MKIGEVASEAGIGIDAVRFYERQGLIPVPARRPSGYRDYSPDVVLNLRFIRHAKDLGFSLKEIGELLSLERDERATAAAVKAAAERKLADIEDRIHALQRMRRVLRRAVDDCPGRGPTTGCSILRSLVREK
jgi:MerR family copper efflux transcriptional regulator